MERLTKIIDGQNAVLADEVFEMGHKFVDDTDKTYYVGSVIDKLAEYENAEEQGHLVKLPCKPGDTVYYIWYSPCKHKGNYLGNKSCVECDSDPHLKRGVCSKTMNSFEHILIEWRKFEEGFYFFTKEDAEKALKEKLGDTC